MDTGHLQSSPAKKGREHRVWVLKLWLGADFFAWLRMLMYNRCSIGLCCLHWFVFISIFSIANTLLRYLQELVWGKRVRETPIIHAPLFIVGHWRSGTTWLHELLTLDQRHNYPTTYQCFFPNHFLLTEWFFSYLFRFFLPSRRPFDNMRMSWDRPQEDEFALCNLGQPSPYLAMAFPNRLPQHPEYFALQKVSREALERWKLCFMRFLKQITIRNPNRIVLKSPTHTYRLKILLELFPNAMFVHIVRNPYVVFASTLNMWETNYFHQGLQHPNLQGLQEYVFDNFRELHEKFDEARPLLSPSRLYEVRYEDLVRDPVGELRAIYGSLELGNFEQVLPRLKEYLAETSEYKHNYYELSPEVREKITRRWGDVMGRYGYCHSIEMPEELNACQ